MISITIMSSVNHTLIAPKHAKIGNLSHDLSKWLNSYAAKHKDKTAFRETRMHDSTR